MGTSTCRSIIAFLFFFLVGAAGCITEPKYSYNYEVKLGKPYDINPNVIGFKEDLKIEINISNDMDRAMTITITSASITANFEDGNSVTISGSHEGKIIIPPHSSRAVPMAFKGVPVRYKLEAEPLRLSPIVSYTVDIEYKGGTKVFFGLIPLSKLGDIQETITPKEINLEEFLNQQSIF